MDDPWIRAWARANGYLVSERGRIATDIRFAFAAAHPEPETVHTTTYDFDWQEETSLGGIYTVTFVRGLNERGVLRGLGAAEADIRPITDDDRTTPGDPAAITARRAGEWTVAIEDRGHRGVRRDVLEALSRDGGEAVAVLRHDFAQHHLAHALDGRLVTQLNPGWPAERDGADPDGLDRHLRVLGIDPDAAVSVGNPVQVALAVAARITGVVFAPEHLVGAGLRV